MGGRRRKAGSTNRRARSRRRRRTDSTTLAIVTNDTDAPMGSISLLNENTLRGLLKYSEIENASQDALLYLKTTHLQRILRHLIGLARRHSCDAHRGYVNKEDIRRAIKEWLMYIPAAIDNMFGKETSAASARASTQ